VQFFPSRVRFPRGESLREAQFRAVQALEDIAARHEKEMVVVVSHADIIRLLLAHYLGVHIDLFQRIVISPASASVLALSSEGMVHVLRVNDDGPLHPPTPPEHAGKEKKKSKRSAMTDKAGRENQAVPTGDPATRTAPQIFNDGPGPVSEQNPNGAAGYDEEE
jgi:probable phosphoglycerate mutase